MGYTGKLFGTQYIETVQDELGEHTVLRYDPSHATGKWEVSDLQPGATFHQPAPLFKKLDISIIEEERGKLGN